VPIAPHGCQTLGTLMGTWKVAVLKTELTQ
jgi:hypothetical protein